VLIPSSVVSSDTGAISWINDLTKQPGVGMVGIIGAVRAVAACVQITYVGSESSRAGFISVGQTTVGAFSSYTTLSNTRSAAEYTTRMPGSTVEYRLEPTDSSQEFTPNNGAPQAEVGNQPCIIVAASGIPASTGIRVRLVSVLEWVPKAGAGVGAPLVPPVSGSSMTHVLQWLNATKPSWQVDLITGLGGLAAAML
jgi:hypothetical protein